MRNIGAPVRRYVRARQPPVAGVFWRMPGRLASLIRGKALTLLSKTHLPEGDFGPTTSPLWSIPAQCTSGAYSARSLESSAADEDDDVLYHSLPALGKLCEGLRFCGCPCENTTPLISTNRRLDHVSSRQIREKRCWSGASCRRGSKVSCGNMCSCPGFSGSHSGSGNFRESFLNSDSSSMKVPNERSIPEFLIAKPLLPRMNIICRYGILLHG